MPSDRKRGAFRLEPGKEHLLDDLAALAARNGRSESDEIVHAIERHLAQPPTVKVQSPKLKPTDIDPTPKRPRGRPKKGSTS